MIELLPCPFCGCPDIDVRTRKTTIVECIGCGAMFIKAAPGKAESRWNTRVSLASMQSPAAYGRQAMNPHQSDDTPPGDS